MTGRTWGNLLLLLVLAAVIALGLVRQRQRREPAELQLCARSTDVLLASLRLIRSQSEFCERFDAAQSASRHDRPRPIPAALRADAARRSAGRARTAESLCGQRHAASRPWWVCVRSVLPGLSRAARSGEWPGHATRLSTSRVVAGRPGRPDEGRPDVPRADLRSGEHARLQQHAVARRPVERDLARSPAPRTFAEPRGEPLPRGGAPTLSRKLFGLPRRRRDRQQHS